MKKKNISAYIEYTGPIEAPIKKDQKLGTLYLYYQDELIETHNVYSREEVKKVNLFSRVLKAFNFLEIFIQNSFLKKFNLGYPEILKINLVLNLKKLKRVRGNDVIRCKIIRSGFSFFNSNNKGKKESR